MPRNLSSFDRGSARWCPYIRAAIFAVNILNFIFLYVLFYFDSSVNKMCLCGSNVQLPIANPCASYCEVNKLAIGRKADNGNPD